MAGAKVAGAAEAAAAGAAKAGLGKAGAASSAAAAAGAAGMAGVAAAEVAAGMADAAGAGAAGAGAAGAEVAGAAAGLADAAEVADPSGVADITDAPGVNVERETVAGDGPVATGRSVDGSASVAIRDTATVSATDFSAPPTNGGSRSIGDPSSTSDIVGDTASAESVLRWTVEPHHLDIALPEDRRGDANGMLAGDTGVARSATPAGSVGPVRCPSGAR